MLKERVKSVLNYKKPAFWIIVVAVVACIVVAVCFLTNPKAAKDTVDESTPDEVTFEAQVLEIHDGYFLVAPEASWALNSADRIEVPMRSMDPALEPQVGDIIEITCSGEILETYPARLSKVYGIKVAKKASTVTKWFDYLEAPNEMKWDGSIDINLTEFPDVTFRWSSGEIVAVKGNEITSLYTGMPIWSVYFCDLTGDGLPELCSSLSFGSGIVDNRVMIYDYANGVSYSMEDRGVTDYILRQNESDGQLYVDKKAHMGGGLLSTGRLVFEDDCLQVLWPEKPNDSIREITDPTDDPNFTYDTAVEKIFEDENNEFFIGGLYSQHIIVYYTDGTQENIVTALDAGRATFVDLDKFGIRYWAEPKADTMNIREDVCELYLKVLEDLWNVDPGLNGGISQIGIDLSELSHLTAEEKEIVMHEFASKHNLPYIAGTWEELCEQGYIDKDNLYWEDGLFFSIKTNEDAVWNLPALKEGDPIPELTAFDAQKWRSGLGAYYFSQCSAQKNADGTWSYTVGQEAIS